VHRSCLYIIDYIYSTEYHYSIFITYYINERLELCQNEQIKVVGFKSSSPRLLEPPEKNKKQKKEERRSFTYVKTLCSIIILLLF